MKRLHHQLLLATALAAGIVVAPLAQLHAEESASGQTNPGFIPDTGQINTGGALQAPSQSSDIRDIPTPEDARAAMFMPSSKQPSAGAPLAGGPQGGDANASVSHAAQPASTQASTTGAATSEKAGTEPAQTVSAGGSAAPTTAAPPPPSGPIGATGQTEPSKTSKRNAILDRVPIMAWPLMLSDQEREQIYKAVMADKSQPTGDADRLMPASELSTEQALNGMHALPESVRDIDGVRWLQYVKGKGKVLLVTPATRTVVAQITS